MRQFATTTSQQGDDDVPLSVCLFVCLPPMRTDDGGGLSHWHWLVTCVVQFIAYTESAGGQILNSVAGWQTGRGCWRHVVTSAHHVNCAQFAGPVCVTCWYEKSCKNNMIGCFSPRISHFIVKHTNAVVSRKTTRPRGGILDLGAVKNDALR